MDIRIEKVNLSYCDVYVIGDDGEPVNRLSFHINSCGFFDNHGILSSNHYPEPPPEEYLKTVFKLINEKTKWKVV